MAGAQAVERRRGPAGRGSRSPLKRLGVNFPPVLVDLACLLAGSVLPLGFAPFGAWFVPPLSLAVLFGGWLHASGGRALWRGWLFGLGMFGVGVSWVQISIHQFGLPVLAFSVSVTVAFVALLALFPAVLGLVASRLLPSRSGFCLLVSWPALWTLGEWVRSWMFTGFPWLNVGYSQIDSPLGGWAPLGGVYLVSWLAAVTGGGVCYLARRPPMASLWLVPLLVMGWGTGVVLREVGWTEDSGQSWRVSLVQGNVEQSLKWDPAKRDSTLALYRELSAPHWGDQLVIWPETAVPAFPAEVAAYLEEVSSLAAQGNSTLLTGMPTVDQTGQRYYNAIVALGASTGEYRKRHLVPFGEYIPMADTLGGLLEFLDIPMSQFSPGAWRQEPVRVGGVPLGLSVCYEDAFGEEVIDALPEAGLLVNVSNDGWFGDSVAPHQHLEMARMRALETGRFLLRATNTGVSAIIDHKGRVVAQAPQFEQSVVKGHARIHLGATPYVAAGNLPVVLAVLLVLAYAFLRRLRRLRRENDPYALYR